MTPDQIKEEARRYFEREQFDDALQKELKRLQAPELSAIRERNRARDYREQRQESVVAQIITLAA